MTRKIYRTAQGRMVDLGALTLKNENVRAVGNMGVNARGDLVDSQNRAVDTRNQQVAKQYRKQTTNVSNTPVKSSAAAVNARPAAQQAIPKPPEDFQDDFEKTTVSDVPVTGLAAAIAKAKQVVQEPIKTTTDLIKTQEGVSKI